MSTDHVTLRKPSWVAITAPGRRTGAAPPPSVSMMRRKPTPRACAISARATPTSSRSRRSSPPTRIYKTRGPSSSDPPI